ncbi:hypothetical protein [Pantoea sp. Nvir]|nr:hypothetical protein [Pantoea sp. Nvir]
MPVKIAVYAQLEQVAFSSTDVYKQRDLCMHSVLIAKIVNGIRENVI